MASFSVLSMKSFTGVSILARDKFLPTSVMMGKEMLIFMKGGTTDGRTGGGIVVATDGDGGECPAELVAAGEPADFVQIRILFAEDGIEEEVSLDQVRFSSRIWTPLGLRTSCLVHNMAATLVASAWPLAAALTRALAAAFCFALAFGAFGVFLLAALAFAFPFAFTVGLRGCPCSVCSGCSGTGCSG